MAWHVHEKGDLCQQCGADLEGLVVYDCEGDPYFASPPEPVLARCPGCGLRLSPVGAWQPPNPPTYRVNPYRPIFTSLRIAQES